MIYLPFFPPPLALTPLLRLRPGHGITWLYLTAEALRPMETPRMCSRCTGRYWTRREPAAARTSSRIFTMPLLSPINPPPVCCRHGLPIRWARACIRRTLFTAIPFLTVGANGRANAFTNNVAGGSGFLGSNGRGPNGHVLSAYERVCFPMQRRWCLRQ